MRLRTRFCLVLASFSVILTIAAVALTRALLVQTAVHADHERARTTLSQGIRLLSAESEALLRTVRDWASWNDTYAFMADRNQSYLDSNLIPGTLEELRINAIVCLDTNRQVAAALVHDSHDADRRTIPPWLSNELLRSGGLLDTLRKKEAVSGFLSGNGELWLAAAAPILTSEDEGPARGTFLMVRRIDASEIARIAAMVQPSLTLTFASRAWPPGQTDIRAITSQMLQARTTIADLYGSGRILLGVILPRDAYSQVSVSLLYLTGWLVVCGAAISLCAFYILNRWVLRSITDSVAALKSGIAVIAAGTKRRPRLQKMCSDEIGELVDAVDAALDAFELSAREADRRRTEAMQSQKLAALGTLVTGIAHEINNPNGVVAININVMRRLLNRLFAALRMAGTDADAQAHRKELAAIEPELGDAAREILSASERIAGLVSSLKAFAQPTPGNMTERVEIPDLVQRAADWMRHELESRHCSLSREIAPDLPSVRGNAQQLLQVLINLIQNACNAVEPPKTTISLRAVYDASGESVMITVADEGMGIPAEHIEHVLDPFFTLRRSGGGTGLGLSISAVIVRAHGGRIRIESVEGKGTRVTVTLPIAKGPRHDD